jgi:hypothetical protein
MKFTDIANDTGIDETSTKAIFFSISEQVDKTSLVKVSGDEQLIDTLLVKDFVPVGPPYLATIPLSITPEQFVIESYVNVTKQSNKHVEVAYHNWQDPETFNNFLIDACNEVGNTSKRSFANKLVCHPIVFNIIDNAIKDMVNVLPTDLIDQHTILFVYNGNGVDTPMSIHYNSEESKVTFCASPDILNMVLVAKLEPFLLGV